jgi:hypothetical protein
MWSTSACFQRDTGSRAIVLGGASRRALPSASDDKVGGYKARPARSEWSNQTGQDTPRSPARGWLRGREWERITRGVYAAALSRTHFEELAAWQLVLPEPPLSPT